MAQLSHHPSIVTIYHAAIAADGRPFLVMEYCSRPGLAERYRQERISVAEALRIGIRLASAVETAHRAGILHRDIKPANVLTTDFGWPALTDFGIAATTGSRSRCDGRHVDPVVAARAARRAPDGRRALRRLLAGGDDLLAARRAGPRSRSPAGRTPRSSWSPGSSGHRCRRRAATTCPPSLQERARARHGEAPGAPVRLRGGRRARAPAGRGRPPAADHPARPHGRARRRARTARRRRRRPDEDREDATRLRSIVTVAPRHPSRRCPRRRRRRVRTSRRACAG